MYLAIIILPLLGSIVSGFFGRKSGISGAQLITCTAVVFTTLFAVVAFFVQIFDYLYTVSILISILIVYSLVHIYSIGYMSHDPHIQRFFSYLSLFTFMMLILVTVNNYLLMFVGWEGIDFISIIQSDFYLATLFNIGVFMIIIGLIENKNNLFIGHLLIRVKKHFYYFVKIIPFIFVLIILVNTLLTLCGLNVYISMENYPIFLYTAFCKLVLIKILFGIVKCIYYKQFKFSFFYITILDLIIFLLASILYYNLILPLLVPFMLGLPFSTVIFNGSNKLFLSETFLKGFQDILVKLPIVGRYISNILCLFTKHSNWGVDSHFRTHYKDIIKMVIPVYPLEKISRFTSISIPTIVEKNLDMSYQFKGNDITLKEFLLTNSEYIMKYISSSTLKYTNLTLRLKICLEDRVMDIYARYENGVINEFKSISSSELFSKAGKGESNNILDLIPGLGFKLPGYGINNDLLVYMNNDINYNLPLRQPDLPQSNKGTVSEINKNLQQAESSKGQINVNKRALDNTDQEGSGKRVKPVAIVSNLSSSVPLNFTVHPNLSSSEPLNKRKIFKNIFDNICTPLIYSNGIGYYPYKKSEIYDCYTLMDDYGVIHNGLPDPKGTMYYLRVSENEDITWSDKNLISQAKRTDIGLNLFSSVPLNPIVDNINKKKIFKNMYGEVCTPFIYSDGIGYYPYKKSEIYDCYTLIDDYGVIHNGLRDTKGTMYYLRISENEGITWSDKNLISQAKSTNIDPSLEYNPNIDPSLEYNLNIDEESSNFDSDLQTAMANSRAMARARTTNYDPSVEYNPDIHGESSNSKAKSKKNS